jgi:hypothetical protein
MSVITIHYFETSFLRLKESMKQNRTDNRQTGLSAGADQPPPQTVE